jgi:hypothetical protein
MTVVTMTTVTAQLHLLANTDNKNTQKEQTQDNK